jgi:hypothetical protein
MGSEARVAQEATAAGDALEVDHRSEDPALPLEVESNNLASTLGLPIDVPRRDMIARQ